MYPYHMGHEIEGLCVTSLYVSVFRTVPLQHAGEFEPTTQTIYRWASQADRDAGRHHGGLTTEREELTRLRRENRRLELEREIQKPRTGFAAPVTAGPRSHANVMRSS